MMNPNPAPLETVGETLHAALHGETTDREVGVACGVSVRLPWGSEETLRSGSLPLRVAVESDHSDPTLSDVSERAEVVAEALRETCDKWGYEPPEAFERAESDGARTVYVGETVMPLTMPPEPGAEQ